MTSRRSWIKQGSLAALGALTLPGYSSNMSIKHQKPAVTLAHMTDMHLMPGNASEEGVRRCLDHIIQHSKHQPDFIMSGGDLIMDALKRDKDEVEAQWAVWRNIKKDYTMLNFKHCIGNHDVWGKTNPTEAKSWAQNELVLDHPYYHFSQNGWHFIVLDSTHMKPDNSWYTAKLDDKQYEWLEDTLKGIPSDDPILILSHIPILGATPFLDGDNAKSGDWKVPGAWMHTDAKKLINLFYNYKNVKVCLSGHIHLYEQLIYNNIYYYCNGAVSGNWWRKEPYEQTKNGYAYMELYDDGTHYHEYINFDWF